MCGQCVFNNVYPQICMNIDHTYSYISDKRCEHIMKKYNIKIHTKIPPELIKAKLEISELIRKRGRCTLKDKLS